MVKTLSNGQMLSHRIISLKVLSFVFIDFVSLESSSPSFLLFPNPENEQSLRLSLSLSDNPAPTSFRSDSPATFVTDNEVRQSATRDSSNLLAHEAAFALGQMQDVDAIPALKAVLNDISLHPIVRHEAAEALGAISLEANIPCLKNSLVSDPAQEVRETCELALSRIEELKSVQSNDESSAMNSSPFLTVDPATPASCSSTDLLREVLLNEEKGMYERYAALFALRNQGGDTATNTIIDSLHAKSALLRHEVAYVLGQLQNKTASAALSRILMDVNEHPMVRHEAAEALGSIADGHCVALLEEFAKDPEPIVAQSCEVALSMLEFERSGKSFEYLYMQTPQV